MLHIKNTELNIKRNIAYLQRILFQLVEYIQENKEMDKALKESLKTKGSFLLKIGKKAKEMQKVLADLQKESGEMFFKNSRSFLLHDFAKFLGYFDYLFIQTMTAEEKKTVFDFILGSQDRKWKNLYKHYLIIKNYYKELKTIVNQYFFKDITLKDEIIVDNRTELWNINGMTYIELPGDYSRVREYAAQAAAAVKDKIPADEYQLLEQQISELIKNAIKHGNKMNDNKMVFIWYQCSPEFYKIIIEDQGAGFTKLDEWNKCNRKKNEAILKNDLELLTQYITFKTAESDETDGGNALFAALEYWDSGLIFNAKKNKLVAVKYFYQ